MEPLLREYILAFVQRPTLQKPSVYMHHASDTDKPFYKLLNQGLKHAGARLLYFPSATTKNPRQLIWVIQMLWASFPCSCYPSPPCLNQGQHPAASSQEALHQSNTLSPDLFRAAQEVTDTKILQTLSEKLGKNSNQCHVHRQEDSECVHIAD